MANYRGRSFTSACSECGSVFTATHQIRADAQADACYERHFPTNARDLKEVMDEAKRQMPEAFE